MKRVNFFLVLILALATFLRFWQLSSVPPSPDWDEVAYGYNAYSILKTGADEYGVKFPVILKSYGDYKPALYSYLTVPSVATFGLNTFAVRLPNALFGVIGVLGTFFLTRFIFKKDDLALLSSFFMAVSPWSIQFSRFSHEAVVGVGLNILTVLFFLKGLKKQKFLILSGLFWAFSFYSYQSEKLFAPLLGLLLFVIYFKDILKIKRKYLALSVLAAVLALSPLLITTIKDPNVFNRATGTSIFGHQTEVLSQSAKALIQDKETGNLLGQVVHNRRVVYAEVFVENYLTHFNPDWLFLKGDLERHHPPGMGVLYLWDLPFILLGICALFKGKWTTGKNKILIFGWFLIAPIPAAFTYDVPHAARDMNVLPVFQIFTALGLIWFVYVLKSKLSSVYLQKIVLGVVSILFIVNFAYFFDQYFNKLNVLYSSEWQYGYKEAISYVNSVEGNYSKVLISDISPMDQSYMFFLFYEKYPPAKYQMGRGANHSFNSYEFRDINWESDKNLQNVLIVGSLKDIPPTAQNLKTFNFLNGKPAIIIAKSER